MLIPIDVGAAVESKPVPAGKYNLQITDAQEAKSQKGKPQFVVNLAIEGHDDAPQCTHYISLPGDGDEPKTVKFKVLMLKRFLVQFGLPVPTSIDTEKMAMSMVGAKAKATLGLSEPTDDGRVYNRLQVDYLPDEGGAGKQGVPPPPKR
jgi:hypothetical protein